MPSFIVVSYRFLVHAGKFQTGYDKPPLHTRYVDKTLSGIKAVQTLLAVMHDDTELFKQFMDNDSFKRWLTDTVFSLADELAATSHMPVSGEPGCVYRGLSGQQCRQERLALPIRSTALLADDNGDIVPALKVHPEFRPGVEVLPQAQGCLGRNGTVAAQDCGNSACGHADGEGELVGAHAPCPQLRPEHITGMRSYSRHASLSVNSSRRCRGRGARRRREGG